MQWSELRASLQLIGEMFHRGGVVTTITSGGGEPLARLMLQPDADMLLRLDLAHAIDPALPERLQSAVQALIADLGDAQHLLTSVQRVAQLGIGLLLGGLAAFSVTRVERILWQVALIAALGLVALLFRWCIRLGMRYAVTWVMR